MAKGCRSRRRVRSPHWTRADPLASRLNTEIPGSQRRSRSDSPCPRRRSCLMADHRKRPATALAKRCCPPADRTRHDDRARSQGDHRCRSAVGPQRALGQGCPCCGRGSVRAFAEQLDSRTLLVRSPMIVGDLLRFDARLRARIFWRMAAISRHIRRASRTCIIVLAWLRAWDDQVP